MLFICTLCRVGPKSKVTRITTTPPPIQYSILSPSSSHVFSVIKIKHIKSYSCIILIVKHCVVDLIAAVSFFAIPRLFQMYPLHSWIGLYRGVLQDLCPVCFDVRSQAYVPLLKSYCLRYYTYLYPILPRICDLQVN